MNTVVKWIKITTDIFDDEKILLMEELPEGDSIIVIWFKLLCLAGKMNNSGVFILNEKIAYTDSMLATIFRRKEKLVKMALQVFEQFGMIEIVDGVITIPNWGKHQNLDEIEKKREYMKGYMRDYRARQSKLICKTPRKTNSKTNVSRTERESESDINLSLTGESSAPARESVYGVYNNVLLTDDALAALRMDFPTEWQRMIDNLSTYMQTHGTEYADHAAVMRKWAAEDAKKKKAKPGSGGNAFGYEAQREYSSEEMDELELKMRLRRTGDQEGGGND